MDVTYIAQIFGPVLVLTGIYAIFLKDERAKAIEDFHANSALTWMEAFLSLILGLAIINTYSQWTASWRVFVTLYGWVLTIRGFLLLFFPKQFCDWFRGKQANAMAAGIGQLVFGIVFMFLGYF